MRLRTNWTIDTLVRRLDTCLKKWRYLGLNVFKFVFPSVTSEHSKRSDFQGGITMCSTATQHHPTPCFSLNLTCCEQKNNFMISNQTRRYAHAQLTWKRTVTCKYVNSFIPKVRHVWRSWTTQRETVHTASSWWCDFSPFTQTLARWLSNYSFGNDFHAHAVAVGRTRNHLSVRTLWKVSSDLYRQGASRSVIDETRWSTVRTSHP